VLSHSKAASTLVVLVQCGIWALGQGVSPAPQVDQPQHRTGSPAESGMATGTARKAEFDSPQSGAKRREMIRRWQLCDGMAFGMSRLQSCSFCLVGGVGVTLWVCGLGRMQQ
jgi:hypothetical protein